MSSNFRDFGDLVLLIGDFHVPDRAYGMPECFQELLNTDKVRHVLCTGNIGNDRILNSLRDLAGKVHVVKGDMDQDYDFPEYKVVQIGDFKIGIIHGHQIIPWGKSEALLQHQRFLDCDILIYGHTHRNNVSEVAGKFFINPGSATGAHSMESGKCQAPSFMLMAIQGKHVVLYVYEEKDGKTEVVMSEFTKPTLQ